MSAHEHVIELVNAGNISLGNSGQVSFPSNLSNALVLDRLNVQIDAQFLPQVANPILGIWEGRSMLTSRSKFIGTTSLPSRGTDGKFSQFSIEVTKAGVDLRTGDYTIGLFTNSSSLNTLVSSCHLTGGQGGHFDTSSISVNGMTERYLALSYTVPSFVKPQSRHDIVNLQKGDQPKGCGPRLSWSFVQRNRSTGPVILDISNVQLPKGSYVAQYFGDNSCSCVASAISFEIY